LQCPTSVTANDIRIFLIRWSQPSVL